MAKKFLGRLGGRNRLRSPGNILFSLGYIQDCGFLQPSASIELFPTPRQDSQRGQEPPPEPLLSPTTDVGIPHSFSGLPPVFHIPSAVTENSSQTQNREEFQALPCPPVSLPAGSTSPIAFTTPSGWLFLCPAAFQTSNPAAMADWETGQLTTSATLQEL